MFIQLITTATAAQAVQSTFAYRLYLLGLETTLWLREDPALILQAVGYGLGIFLILFGIRWAARACWQKSERWFAPFRLMVRGITDLRIWFMVVAAIHQAFDYASAPYHLNHVSDVIFAIAACAQLALVARDMTGAFLEHRARRSEGVLNALAILNVLTTVFYLSAALVFALWYLGVDPSGVLAGLGIGGIAIGLAAQGIVADLIAALSILFDRPFRRGDTVRFEDTEGVVEAIGFKSTRIRADSGEQVVISNNNLLDKDMHNLARRPHRQFTVMLGINYRTPTQLCRTLPDEVRPIVDAEPGCLLVRCGIDSFEETRIVIEIRFNVEGQDSDDAFMTKHRILVGILEKCDELGIDWIPPDDQNS